MDSSVRYLPWVGDQYRSAGGAFGLRLLLVGESMYERHPGGLTAQIIPDMIGSILRGEWTHRFYTSVRRTVGAEYDLHTFWQGLAFYNFVQFPVGDGPRQRPTEQAWSQSREPFVAVLTHLAPQAVLFLGRQLWWQSSGLDLVRPSGDGTGRTAVGQVAEAAWINHPSSRGFSPERWAGHVMELLAHARQSLEAAATVPDIGRRERLQGED